MKTALFRILAGLVIVALVTDGCVGRRRQADEYRRSVSDSRRAPGATPEVDDICDIDAIDMKKDAYQQGLEDGRAQLAAAAQYANAARSRPIVVSRMNQFDAEIDAQYRAVTSSCKAFSRCMQQNYWNEGKCQSTLSRWERADRDFQDLARELREIDAEVAKIAIVSPKGRRGGRDRLNRYDDCECSVGGVFSDCC